MARAVTGCREACRSMADDAEADVNTLLDLSGELYTRWEADAAFYTLRAAFAAAVTRRQYARLRAVAVSRRDEALIAASGVSAANHGCRTTDRATNGELVTRGFDDSYSHLVADLDSLVTHLEQDADVQDLYLLDGATA